MNDIASHLNAILGRLCLAVTAFMAAQARGPQHVWLGTQVFIALTPPTQHRAIPSQTWTLLTTRLARLAQRLRTLFARYQAGTLPTPRPTRTKTDATRPPYERLPTARGWINARIPATAPCAGTIEILLNTPDIQKFVQAAPQAGRLLRPLCRMLAITPPEYLRLPPRPKPAPLLPSPRLREPEGGPPPQTTPDRPLPNYVRAAARAWKKYDR